MMDTVTVPVEVEHAVEVPAEAIAAAAPPPSVEEITAAAAVAVGTAETAAALANTSAAAAEMDAAERTRNLVAEADDRWNSIQSEILSLKEGQAALGSLIPPLAERLSSIQTLLQERQAATVTTETPEGEVQTVTVESGEGDPPGAETAAERARHRFL